MADLLFTWEFYLQSRFSTKDTRMLEKSWCSGWLLKLLWSLYVLLESGYINDQVQVTLLTRVQPIWIFRGAFKLKKWNEIEGLTLLSGKGLICCGGFVFVCFDFQLIYMWVINKLQPEVLQFRGFTVDVALTPLSGGVSLRMQASWSAGSTAACSTVTQRCHLQHGESHSTIYKQTWRNMSGFVSLSKCLDTHCLRLASLVVVHLLSGAGFGKQELKPPEIMRCPGNKAYQVICFWS